MPGLHMLLLAAWQVQTSLYKSMKHFHPEHNFSLFYLIWNTSGHFGEGKKGHMWKFTLFNLILDIIQDLLLALGLN